MWLFMKKALLLFFLQFGALLGWKISLSLGLLQFFWRDWNSDFPLLLLIVMNFPVAKSFYVQCLLPSGLLVSSWIIWAYSMDATPVQLMNSVNVDSNFGKKIKFLHLHSWVWWNNLPHPFFFAARERTTMASIAWMLQLELPGRNPGFTYICYLNLGSYWTALGVISSFIKCS